ncbi:MAG: T9SS type A sorting domain-containing protein [Fidelibacterota bacterium]
MKKYFLFAWILFSSIALEAELLTPKTIEPGTRRYLVLRVEFQEDDHSVTTGNGRFMINEWTGHDTTYVVDPLPHDRSYFHSHLKFIDHYWSEASKGRIRIDTADALLLPAEEDPYILNRKMRYYSDPDSIDHRLAALVYESVNAAIEASGSIADNDGVIIYHAGVGQDFNIDLDDSPFDIPSFYFDENYLSEYLSADKFNRLVSNGCSKGIVLPESQNQLKQNIALNGTEILMTGMLLGLPPLYDTELGRSGAGIFGLMDQGSNRAGGLCPVKPSAYERFLLGSAEPVEIIRSQRLRILRDEVYKIPLSSNEYFLIEFRKNTGFWADSLLWSRNDIRNHLDVLSALDSLGVLDYRLENGVLTHVSDHDVSLPASGLLIWHIVEPETFGENPNRQRSPFLDLVEADGGDDIGKFYNTLDPSVNNGWKWDMWFRNNPAFSDNNPDLYRMQFNDESHPDTRSVNDLPSGIAIQNFHFYTDSVVLELEMDTPVRKNVSNTVFDEFTTALPAVFTSPKTLIGYRDSSLFLYSAEDGLRKIYSQNKAYEKQQTALLTQGNALLQVLNTDGGAEITKLRYQPSGMLSAENLFRFDYELDLDHLALSGDSLFLPALSAENPAQFLHTGSTWALTDIDTSAVGFVPYIRNGEFLAYIKAREAAVMNDTLIVADNEPGFSFVSGTSGETAGPMAEEHTIRQLIPVHLNEDGVFELLALTTFNGRSTLSAFTHAGYLLDGFPVFNDYRELRVYYLDGDPQILAYDPSGTIDAYSVSAELLYSLPAPVNAASLFMEQVSADSAWLVADGSIYTVRSDSVYWGYRGKDAVHSNAHRTLQSATPVVSTTLIRDGLIYNYPNPVENGMTKFRYFATGAHSVTINIYQLNGRHVETLTQMAVNQQWNEIRWDVSDHESGVYIARISVGDGSRTETYFVKPAILK